LAAFSCSLQHNNSSAKVCSHPYIILAHILAFLLTEISSAAAVLTRKLRWPFVPSEAR
jgi:hypothetical protein